MSSSLLGAAEVRRLAEQIGLRPTKTLGQNFVHDANTVRRIVSAADLDGHRHVLEVGPGLGSLTLGLLDRVAVTAVEIDPRLAGLLPDTAAAHGFGADRLRVLTEDAMRVRLSQVVDDRFASGLPPTALVANLPYNVAVPVVMHLLAELPSVRRVLVMVQAEVADRLSAGPGSKIYGAPSVKAAWYGKAKRAGAVPRSVFWPVPGVDSALVAIDRHDDAVISARGIGPEAVFPVIEAAFAQRRKTLRSALAGWAGSPDAAENAIRAAGVDPSARGEVLPLDAFVAIAGQRR